VRISFSRHSPNWRIVKNFYLPCQKQLAQHTEIVSGNEKGWRVGLYFYSPIRNSTRIWQVGEWLSAPLTVVVGTVINSSAFNMSLLLLFAGSRAPSAFSNHGYTHQGYYPMQPVYPAPPHGPGSVYSYGKDPFMAPPGSAYSSQPSHHRSYTPTSSKSGKSNRSNNSTSVTYSQGTEKVALPVSI
jgi:hypothetical protein